MFGDLRSAARAFSTADRHWEPAADDLGDVLGYEVRYLALKASLRREQRQLAEARTLIEAALNRDMEGRVKGQLLVSKAKILEESGDLEGAVGVLEFTVVLTETDPRLRLCIEHNLVWLLAGLGRYEDAQALLPSVIERSRALGNPLDLLRLQWLQGRVCAGFGDEHAAEHALLQVKARFGDRGMSFDSALVSLELALLYAQSGRSRDVQELAAEVLPVFEAQSVDREALMSLTLICQTTTSMQRAVELLGEVISLVRSKRPSSHTLGTPGGICEGGLV